MKFYAEVVKHIKKFINRLLGNDKSIYVTSSNISICNGKIFVDDVELTLNKDTKFCVTEVIVNAEHVELVAVDSGNITINASVYGNVTNDCGNITINGDLTGDASTDCGNVKIKGEKLPKGPALETIKGNAEFFGKSKTMYYRDCW
jgi:hypothetical protein